MIGAQSTVDGRGVKITVYRAGGVTCSEVLDGGHGDHGALSIMAECALVDH
jgi:hypothetical protein